MQLAASLREPAIYASPRQRSPGKEEHVGGAGQLQPVGIYFSGCDRRRMADRFGARSLAAHDMALSGWPNSRHYRRFRRVDPHRYFIRLRKFMSEDGESRAQSFYSGALARIPHFMVGLAVVLSGTAW